MDELRIEARAVLCGGELGEVFARASGATPLACLAAIEEELARRLPPQAHSRGGEAAEALELRLSWGGEGPAGAGPCVPERPRAEGQAARPPRPREAGAETARAMRGPRRLACAASPSRRPRLPRLGRCCARAA